MTLYLDASVLLPMFVTDAHSAAVDRFVDLQSEGLLVSDFAAAEVGSAVSRLVRMNALSVDDALMALADFDGWQASRADVVELQPADVRLTNVLVRRFELKLRAPDALHVAVTQRLGLVLATLDARLALAAQSLGVRVEVPS